MAWHTRLNGYAVSSLNSRYGRTNIDNLASGLVAENEGLTDYELSYLAMLASSEPGCRRSRQLEKGNIVAEDSFIHQNRRAPSQSL